MGVKRTILRPVAFVAGLHARRQTAAFLAAHHRTRQVQDELLAELIARHRDTAFGRDHSFAAIHNYADFKAAVPVGNYETHRPYVERVLAGETTALLPDGSDGEVLMFSLTSGTTGAPKHIPVTRRFLAQMRRGWNIWGLRALLDHKAAWLRPILQISSPVRETTSPTGLPCGAISGMLAETQQRIVRRMYVVPPVVASIEDPAAKYYTTLRCAVGHDVAFITTANPSSIIRLIETGQAHAERLVADLAAGTLSAPGEVPAELAARRFRPDPALARRLEEGIRRDGRLLPRHFWNLAFLANWTGGTLRLYLRRLRELFGNLPIRDVGLLASEGRFSVPLSDDTAAGVAEITGSFLEFIPVECHGLANPPTLRAQETEIGHEYSLVFSNWAGLWRYDLDDRIRVVDRLGDSPVFEFLSRGRNTANITGEKLTEHQVVEAMRRATAGLGAAVERFVVQGCFAATPYYQVRLEAVDGLNVGQLSERLDAELALLNIEYHSKRKSGRLGAVQAVVLPAGQLESQEAQRIRLRRGRDEQYKHQYLLTEVVEDTD
jgi:hypothetical protein